MNTAASSTEAESFSFPPLRHNLEATVVVVGAGVAGLTAALKLLRAGRSVVLLEPGRVGDREREGTAHLTELLDTHYQLIESRFGFREASLTATSVRLAIDCIERLAREVDCRFERVPAFLFAENETHRRELQDEYDALKRVGARVSWLKQPLPIPVAAAARVDDQALLEPRAYVQALARRFVAEGGQLFEGTEVRNVDEESPPCVVQTEHATVLCRDVVITIDRPGTRAFFPAGLQEETSPVIAAPFASELPNGLYVDIRDPRASTHTAERFGAVDTSARRIVTSADGLPLIGRSSATSHVFIATGFGNADVTFATVGAMLLNDSVRGVSNSLAELFDPARSQPRQRAQRRNRSPVREMSNGSYVRH
ncbi:MAG: hypothetical protein DI536_24195 [Archangium gephyra]|uniref:FAD dependent oxidoreductase domain-containing protein n=1 Tax=Archangium gephyra TaxID=48 RepID=A0A2W5SYR4_9BACT|nr:MAG: hypothetical protein DI536_24195 [Archangium gephyra]